MNEALRNRIEAKRQEIQTVYEVRAIKDITTAKNSVQALLVAIEELVTLSQEREIDDVDG